MNHSILVELAHALSTEEFVARLPEPVLVVLTELARDEASGEDDTNVGDEVSGAPGRVLSDVPPRFEALAIRRKRTSSDPTRITLGRDRGCDLVVRTPGVSKLHAAFRPGPPLEVYDCGSQNGTFADGARLDRDRAVAVRAGMQLTFGDLVTLLVTPQELYRLLKTGAR